MSDFTHLHLHTEYSLLDGLPKIGDLVDHAKKLGMDSLAITDHGVMYGAIEFYKACTDRGVKPIIGIEAYVSKGDHRLKEKSAGRYKDNNHLVLLAKNDAGYRNLLKLTTIAHLEGFYYKPRFDKKTLKKHAQGLICLSACLIGEVSEYLSLDEYTKAQTTATWFANLFGDDYYLELQRHNHRDFVDQAPDNQIRNELIALAAKEKKVNEGILKLSRELGIPIVASNDVHYITPEQAQAQDALVCIQTGKDVSDTNRLRYVDSPSFFLRDPRQMADLFADLPEAISNTKKIADKCDLTIKLGDWFFPKIGIPKGKSAGEHLRDIAYQGAKDIYGQLGQAVKDRIDFELGVIDSRGYSQYFLIVGDMVNWCRESGIVTTTRGSAAGSLILYATGITEVDPLKYNLPFERFLNPHRPSPPDIDLDIADNRRGELIAYITGKYGADKVAQICTFGRMLARASVRDIGRVLGFPYSFPDKLAKAIPEGSQGFPMTIKKALDISTDLKQFYKDNLDAKRILDLALQIEGNARHVSVHAAGLVISPSQMTDFSPLQKESGGEKAITQYEMHSCEDVGLIKFDILGIRNLAILNSAVDIIQTQTGHTIDIKNIPLDDQQTFAMLSRGETMGTFQLGGSGMTRYLTELKPERVEDLMAMVALYRPGPMANIPEYIKRKNNPKLVKYLHPQMKKFLDTSYGILVYQEDILFTAIELAGYDWGSVDKLRKAVGKKIPEEMKKQEKIFIQGCIKHSKLSPQLARQLWDLFVPFQGYGFNKAHAAAYGLVAYQTAYLKAHYPVEFMTAVLTAESEHTDKVALAIEECKRMKIPVLPPDINTSDTDFTIVDDSGSKYKKAIRFGFNAIKNVGAAAIDSLIETRDKQGGFSSLTHLCSQVDGRRVNKKVLESLIKVGAMDQFGTRASLLEGLDQIRDQAAKLQKQAVSGQDSLFDISGDASSIPTDRLPPTKELPKSQLLAFEKELLGLYLTEHPMAETFKHIESKITHKISDLDSKLHQGHEVTLGGLVSGLRTTFTKKSGAEMAFLTLEGIAGKIDVVVFPRVWDQVKTKLQTDQAVLVSGKLDYRDDKLNLIAATLNPIKSGEVVTDSDFVIEIPRGTETKTLQKIGQILKKNPGEHTISVIISGNHAKTIPLPYKVNYDSSIKQSIQKLLSP